MNNKQVSIMVFLFAEIYRVLWELGIRDDDPLREHFQKFIDEAPLAIAHRDRPRFWSLIDPLVKNEVISRELASTIHVATMEINYQGVNNPVDDVYAWSAALILVDDSGVQTRPLVGGVGAQSKDAALKAAEQLTIDECVRLSERYVVAQIKRDVAVLPQNEILKAWD